MCRREVVCALFYCRTTYICMQLVDDVTRCAVSVPQRSGSTSGGVTFSKLRLELEISGSTWTYSYSVD